MRCFKLLSYAEALCYFITLPVHRGLISKADIHLKTAQAPSEWFYVIFMLFMRDQTLSSLIFTVKGYCLLHLEVFNMWGQSGCKTDVQCVAVKLSSSQAGTHSVFSNSQFSPLRDNNWQDALCFCLRHAMPAVLDLQPITVWLRPPQRPDRAVSFLSGWKKRAHVRPV